VPATVLNDCFEPTLGALLALKPLFLLRDGILNPLERALRQGMGNFSISTARPAERLRQLLALHGLEDYAKAPPGMAVRPTELLDKIGQNILRDLTLLAHTFEQRLGLSVEGDAASVYVHPTAVISPHAVFDTTGGPVVVDCGAKIAALSYVKGPAYVGKYTQLEQCRFSNSIAGENCRLGGEIADSIIGNFSNKHHDGFLGHSLVGDWVNLGALTTTSDLKNNYGEVRLRHAGKLYPTGSIKFGAIIGDYAKTAIGTLLGTGTIVGVGANLFGESHWSGDIAPFTWGREGIYDRALFIRDAGRMMQRRGQSVSAELEELLRTL
jgi:glucose-1-phosphate thymidylyltransferase